MNFFMKIFWRSWYYFMAWVGLSIVAAFYTPHMWLIPQPINLLLLIAWFALPWRFSKRRLEKKLQEKMAERGEKTLVKQENITTHETSVQQHKAAQKISESAKQDKKQFVIDVKPAKKQNDVKTHTVAKTQKQNSRPKPAAALEDLNTASEESFRELVAGNLILARKIIMSREREGAFTSWEDFSSRVHVSEQTEKELKEKYTIKEPETATMNTSARIIDF